MLCILKDKIKWHCPLCLLITPGAIPLNLTPGVSDPDQLDRPTSVVHLKVRVTCQILTLLTLLLKKHNILVLFSLTQYTTSIICKKAFLKKITVHLCVFVCFPHAHNDQY